MKRIINFEKDRMDMKQMASINGGYVTHGSYYEGTAQGACGDTNTVCYDDEAYNHPITGKEVITSYYNYRVCNVKNNACT